MKRIMGIAGLGAMAMAAARMESIEVEGGEWEGDIPAPNLTPEDIKSTRRTSVQTCNISIEEQVERDRPKSRQERRQLERLARKGRV